MFLSLVPAGHLVTYIDQCLEKNQKTWAPKGVVLQDIINELGRRLEFAVEPGLYQGVSGKVGFDGLWIGDDGFAMVVEAKTSDGFPIHLETVANYRRQLISAGKIGDNSSMLMVVGLGHTGNLEAQIRGSRWAWDTRMISMHALAKLVALKEQAGAETVKKIHALLRPVEYTRLDALIDIVFAAAKDVEEAAAADGVGEGNECVPLVSTDVASVLEVDNKRSLVIDAFSRKNGIQLFKRTRALYWDSAKKFRVACTLSKRYEGGGEKYWYAYHPNMDAFLSEGGDSYIIFGTMDQNVAFALPFERMRGLLAGLNTTTKADGKTYWHIKIAEPASGVYHLILPRQGKTLDLGPYTFGL